MSTIDQLKTMLSMERQRIGAGFDIADIVDVVEQWMGLPPPAPVASAETPKCWQCGDPAEREFNQSQSDDGWRPWCGSRQCGPLGAHGPMYGTVIRPSSPPIATAAQDPLIASELKHGRDLSSPKWNDTPPAAVIQASSKLVPNLDDPPSAAGDDEVGRLRAEVERLQVKNDRLTRENVYANTPKALVSELDAQDNLRVGYREVMAERDAALRERDESLRAGERMRAALQDIGNRFTGYETLDKPSLANLMDVVRAALSPSAVVDDERAATPVACEEYIPEDDKHRTVVRVNPSGSVLVGHQYFYEGEWLDDQESGAFLDVEEMAVLDRIRGRKAGA